VTSTSPLSKAAVRELLLGFGLVPGDHVLDATSGNEFTELLEFLGLIVEDSDERPEPGRCRLVLAQSENHSPIELSRMAADWLSRLRPGGTLLLVNAERPDVLSAFPGSCRHWSTGGVTLSSLTISSLARQPSEWRRFVSAETPATDLSAA
jgi:hypothetical protein